MSEVKGTFEIKRSISYKIIFLYVVLAFVNVLVITSLISINQSDIISDNVLLKTEVLLSDYANQIDESSIDTVVNGFNNDGIQWSVFSTEGEVRGKSYGSFDASDDNLMNIKKVILLNKTKQKRYMAKLDLMNMRIDNYIALSKWNSESEVLMFRTSFTQMSEAISYLIKIVILSILATLIISGVTAFVLFRLMIKPLYVISEGTKKIANGDLDHTVTINNRDEFGLVAFGFNKMVQQIKTNMEELHIQMDLIKKAKKRIEIMASTDELTQVFNRRALFEKLDGLMSLSERYKHKVGLLMFDIDHFKAVNDTYGHHAGDVVLKNVSTLLKDVVRKVDVIGRYGGEEFVIVLPETDIVSSLIAAEKVRKAVERLKIDTGNEIISVTISIGVSELTILKDKHQTITPESFINFADSALYVAKESGRNRVEKNNG